LRSGLSMPSSVPLAAVAFPASPGAEPARRRLPNRGHVLDSILAVLIVFLAAGLRLAQLGNVQYREDDDELWNIVTRLAHTGQVPLTGMHSSIGLSNGPFQALLLAPFGWIGADPALMTAGVSMLNVIAVVLVYGFAREFFGRSVALLAMLLTAVNPWAVVLSRRLWGDDMVAPFAVLALWMLCRWLCHGQDRALPIAAAALAVVAQVYIVGLECLVTAALALLLGLRRLPSRWTLMALLVFVGLSAPYVAGVVLPRLQALGNIGSTGSGHAAFDLTAVRYALDLASEEGYQAFAMQGGSRLDATGGVPAIVGMVGRLLYLFGIALGIFTVIRGPGRITAAPRGIHLLLLVAIILPMLVLLRHSVPVYPYYLVTTFPAPYLYQAVAVRQLWHWAADAGPHWRRVAQAALFGGVGFLVAVPLALAGVFFAVIGQYWPAAIYGIPWNMSNHLVQETMQLQQRYGADRVFIPQASQELNVLYRLLAQRGAPAMEFDENRLLVLSNSPSLYLAIGDAPAQAYLDANYRPDLVHQETLPGAHVEARWYVLPPDAARAPLPASMSAENWVVTADGQPLLRIDGIQLPDRLSPRGTATAIATVALTALQQPGPTIPDFSMYLHLVDAAGRTVAGQDQPVLPSHDWQSGDRVIQWFALSLPSTSAPAVLHSSLGVYSVGLPNHPVIKALTIEDAGRHILGDAGEGPSVLVPPPPPGVPTRPFVLQFAGGIVLNGDDVRQDGSTLAVTLHWQAASAVLNDYTAFVHVLDGSGKLIAQHDGPPMQGNFPTSFWQPGDRLADVHAIALPANLPAGTYHLEFGLYDSHTLQRLAIRAGQAKQAITLPLP
jgi:4-amino-4-deoxy-L-arabinose transferase-like glycosyltransferase